MGAKERPVLGVDEYQHVVVLVHGTFARGASWTRPDSPLAMTVTKALGGSVLSKSFDWSGQNSHTARLSAGTDLAERLRSLSHKHPNASLQIVAHSHGGNVAAYALRSPQAQASVKSVVCLGTPFIVARPRNLEPTLRLIRFVSVMAIASVALFVALLTGNFIAMVVDPQMLPADLKGDGDLIIGAPLVLGVVGALSYLAIRLLLRLDRKVETTVAPRLRAMQTKIVTSLQAKFDKVSVLNIQTRHDEAGGWLRFVDRFAGMPFRVWSPTLVFWIMASPFAIVAIGLTTMMVANYSNIAAELARHPDEYFLPAKTVITRSHVVLSLMLWYEVLLFALALVLAGVTLIALGACALWPKIFRAHALGFGEDGFMKNWLVAISASTDPPGAELKMHDELLDVTGQGLHHSLLYQDEQVLGTVADWMSDHGRGEGRTIH